MLSFSTCFASKVWMSKYQYQYQFQIPLFQKLFSDVIANRSHFLWETLYCLWDIYLFIYLFFFFCILLRKPYVVYIFAFGTQRILKLFILFDIFKHNYLFINYLSKWVAPVFEQYLLILTNGVQKLGIPIFFYIIQIQISAPNSCY